MFLENFLCYIFRPKNITPSIFSLTSILRQRAVTAEVQPKKGRSKYSVEVRSIFRRNGRTYVIV